MKMKTEMNKIKSGMIKLTLIALVVSFAFYACKDDDDDAMPSIKNFRVVEKDSSITAGAFGLYIAIQGSNLQSVKEVWFNDVKAFINPNFVTSSNIICAVPSKLPGELLNKVRLVTKSGKEFSTDFKVDLPKPIVKGLYNEMAAPGSTTKVLGDYLFFIKSVKIGDLNAEILAQSEHATTIKIPDGAQPGSLITVEGDGGTSVAIAKYRDEGVWLADFDQPGTTWFSTWCWGSWMNDFREDEQSINKKYGFIERELKENEEYISSTCGNYPTKVNKMDLTGKVLKFEVKANEPWVWTDNLKAEEHATFSVAINEMWDKSFNFRPQEWTEYKTTGFKTNDWMTVTVPLSVMGITGVTTIDNLRLTFKPNKQAYNKFSTYFDNFRICTPN